MSIYKSSDQLAALLLIPLLFAYLSAGIGVQLYSDLEEIDEHLIPGTGSSRNLLSLPNNRHICHSCLVSHPNMSANFNLDRSLQVTLQKDHQVEILELFLTPLRYSQVTNSRSPPA